MDNLMEWALGILGILFAGGFAVWKISSKRTSGDVTQKGNTVNNGDIVGGDKNINKK